MCNARASISEGAVFLKVPLVASKACTDPEESDHTVGTVSLYDDALISESSPYTSWRTTGTSSFLLNSPLLVSNPDEQEDASVENAAQKLGKIIAESKRLPNCKRSYFASNHLMINQERIQRCVAPLIRLGELDEIAREQAQRMANEQHLFHIDQEELCKRFQRPYRRMGENVSKGRSIRNIHREMMESSLSKKNNIIDRRYTHMGMGTARGLDGDIYLCQVFRG